MGLRLFPDHHTEWCAPENEVFTDAEIKSAVGGEYFQFETDTKKPIFVNKMLFESGEMGYNERATDMYCRYQEFIIFGVALVAERHECIQK